MIGICGVMFCAAAFTAETPLDAIRSAVRDTIALLGKDGGYFCSADQFMPYPQEHVNGMWEAVRDFGRYDN